MAKTLVIYYSRKGENYFNGSLKTIAKGNTEIVAEYIRDAVGADLFEVDTVKDYDASYMVCIDEAKEELRRNARPEIKESINDIAAYAHMIILLWRVRVGGGLTRWRFSPNSKHLILAAKPCSR